MTKQTEPFPSDLPERLKVARQLAGLTQDAASSALDIARTTLVAIEKGERRIKIDELKDLAEIYKTTVNALLRQESVKLDFSTKFRRAAVLSEDSSDVIAAIRLLEKLTLAYTALESATGMFSKRIDLPTHEIHSYGIEEQAEDVAFELRQRLGIGFAPFQNIHNLVENEIGVKIFSRPMSSKISGLYAYDRNVGTSILVNQKHPKERQNMTIAHELGHLMSSRDLADLNLNIEMRNDNLKEERFANHFALALLLPAQAVRKQFREIAQRESKFSSRHLLWLGNYFGVSVEGVCRRLEALRLLPDGTFDSIKERGFSVAAMDLNKGNQNSMDKAVPSRIAFLAAEAQSRGLFSEEQLCEMLELSRVELREYFDVIGHDPDGN